MPEAPCPILILLVYRSWEIAGLTISRNFVMTSSSDIFFFSASVFLFLCCIVLYLRCFKQSSLRHPDEKAAYSQLSVFDPNDDDAIDDIELEEMK